MKTSASACTLLLVVACSSNRVAGNDSGPRRSDSAGVEFVRNPFDSLRGDDSLAIEEVRRIGAVEGEPAYLLSRVSDLVLDDDLTVYLASQSTGTIRVFGPDGKVLREIGRRGEGPGEVRSFDQLEWAGNDLALTDWQGGGRTVVLTREGKALHSWNSTLPGKERITLSGWTPQGWVGTNESRPVADGPGKEVLIRARLRRMNLDKDSIGEPYIEAIPWQLFGSKQGGQDWPLMQRQPSFGFDAKGQFYQSHSLPYRIDVRDAEGKLVRVIEKGYRPVPVPENLAELILAEKERFFDTTTSWLRQANRNEINDRVLAQAEMPRPSSMPPGGPIMVASDGTFWIERIDQDSPAILEFNRYYGHSSGAARASKWDLFDSDGTYRGFVRLPPRFKPMALRRDHVAGVILDENDVEFIAIFRVEPNKG